jgi:hypothetical protein
VLATDGSHAGLEGMDALIKDSHGEFMIVDDEHLGPLMTFVEPLLLCCSM